MYQFFVADAQIADGAVTIEGSDVNHIRSVLRMRCGERVRVSTDSGKNYYAVLSDLSGQTVRAKLDGEAEDTELPCRISLFQGLPKGDKMELIIQKAVELGVYEVVPVAMRHCVTRLDGKKAETKVARWQKIARNAAEQSKRSRIPTIQMPLEFSAAVDRAGSLDVLLLPYENERGMRATREALEALEPGQSVGIFIGPEGGFAESEIALADQAGMRRISLGSRILRTETAGIAALSILMYQIESRCEKRGERGTQGRTDGSIFGQFRDDTLQ